jgi:hypothetical protein
MDSTAVWEELAQAFPHSLVMGCSTAGEIAGTCIRDHTLSLAVVRFEHTTLKLVSAALDSPEASDATARALADQLPGQDLRAVFVLTDGLAVNGSRLIAGLADCLPDPVLITGGMAGDGVRFGRTWVLHGGRPKRGQVTALGLYGERLKVAFGCDGGWLGFGPERRITRSQGNVLFTLDDKPALDLYLDYLGELASDLPGSLLLFPLSIHAPGAPDHSLVRTVLAVDEVARSITFAGDVPEGHLAQLMRTTEDSLIASAAQAGAQATASVEAHSPSLLVSVSCVGRRLVLGERTEEEVEAVMDAAPADAGHVGFYSYGEFSPLLSDGQAGLHNQTMTVTVFSET